MSEKMIGYSLLVIGILIICFTGFSVYTVFTKQAEPVQLFNFQGIGINVSQIVSGSLPSEISQFVAKNKEPQTTEIISADMLNVSSNFIAHYILMGFLASIGFKLATLGTMLVRPIVVKLKTKEVEVEKV